VHALALEGGASISRKLEVTALGPLSAFVFKVAAHPSRGPLCFFRVYSGEMRPGQALRVVRPVGTNAENSSEDENDDDEITGSESSHAS